MNEELCPIKFCLQSNLHLAVVRFACSLICLQSSLLGCSPICLQSDLRLAAFQFAWLHSDLPAVRFALGCIPICLQSDLRLAAFRFACSPICAWLHSDLPAVRFALGCGPVCAALQLVMHDGNLCVFSFLMRTMRLSG